LAVVRRGKHLLMWLDCGCLALHFRLDGQFLRSDSRKFNEHGDVVSTSRAGTLGFVDRLQCGRVELLDSIEQHPGISSLRTESLSTDFTAARFALPVANSRRPPKQFLLD
jgi:formamidopyrimidine-DNA glycosylase